jgi:hypothetical protein
VHYQQHLNGKRSRFCVLFSCLVQVEKYIKTRSLILKLGKRCTEQFEKGEEEASILRIKVVPSLAIVLMGSIDCLTTTIGILYFGAVECNPFLAGITMISLPAFAVIKLAATIFAVLLLSLAEKILMKAQDKNSKAFVRTRYVLKGAYTAVVIFLLITVLNNIIAIARTI